MNKKSGAYYTPYPLASFISDYLFNRLSPRDKVIKILEPSCGEGVFLKAISQSFWDIDFKVDAVEYNKEAAVYSQKLADNLLLDCNVEQADYLTWSFDNANTYDLVVGNPPYISKKLLTDEQKELCQNIHATTDEFGSEIHNIWTSFLADGINRLNEKGILAFVLPAELLKVKFGEKIQKELLNKFQRIEIFTFSTNVFPNIEQDTIILFLYKQSKQEGLYFTTINSTTCLIKNRFKLKRKRSLEKMKLKWSSYPLLEKQIKKIGQIKRKIPSITDYCETIPGIVTAANNYFIATKTTVDEYELEEISKPIIQKGIYINGCVTLSESKLGKLISDDKPAFFLDFSKTDFTNSKHKEYLERGKECKIHQRYKCTLRDKWYEVPGAWISEGFFFKRCHGYPKFIFNEASALVTDASYRVKVKEGYDIKSLIFSFYNSMTLAFSELQGRYYGGGVLELTPNEFKTLPIPYIEISEESFANFVEAFHKKRSIEEILEVNDQLLLEENLGFSAEEIGLLRDVRTSLLSRRLSISKSQLI